MESENETLAISTPAVRNARPWCPPEGSRAAVVEVTDARQDSAPRQWSDSSIKDPQQFSGVFGSHVTLPAPTEPRNICLSYLNCETGHRLVRGRSVRAHYLPRVGFQPGSMTMFRNSKTLSLSLFKAVLHAAATYTEHNCGLFPMRHQETVPGIVFQAQSDHKVASARGRYLQDVPLSSFSYC
jgi:hypothetical protein